MIVEDSQGQMMMQKIDDINSKIIQAIRKIDQFEYDPQKNAMHISFEPIQIHDTDKFDKQAVIDKLLKLQKLSHDNFLDYQSKRYERDELAIETKKMAEKVFYSNY